MTIVIAAIKAWWKRWLDKHAPLVDEDSPMIHSDWHDGSPRDWKDMK